MLHVVFEHYLCEWDMGDVVCVSWCGVFDGYVGCVSVSRHVDMDILDGFVSFLIQCLVHIALYVVFAFMFVRCCDPMLWLAF